MTSIQFGTYAPRKQKDLVDKILLVKLEGPFDKKGNIVEKPIAGFKYIFKAYTNTLSLEQMFSFSAPLTARWGKLAGKKIEEIQHEPFSYSGRIWSQQMNCYIYSQEITYQHMLLYAYLDSPSDDVSVLLNEGYKPFYYKGTKKWGTLQSNDDSIAGLLKQGHQMYQAENKAGTIGADTIDKLKNETEENLRALYEGGDFSQLNLGTRDVLREETADLVINNFYEGGGKKLSFDTNTRISEELVKNGTFKNYFSNYLNAIKEILENPEYNIKTINGSDIERVFSSIKAVSKPNFSKVSEMYVRNIANGGHEYYGLMGGTQTIQVDLEIVEEDNDIYNVKTKMYIGDWYGSDWDDINQGKYFDEIFQELQQKQTKIGKVLLHNETSANAQALYQLQKKEYKKGYIPSLNAFFMLQYHLGSMPGNENKYLPFETEIIFESTDRLKIQKEN